jgi:hypothetical protein
MGAYALQISSAAFGQSCERFEAMISWLDGPQAQELTHGELEARLQTEGRELLRQLTQDHLDLRAAQETRLGQVVGADGVRRDHAETGRTRSLGHGVRAGHGATRHLPHAGARQPAPR